jgi:hypothetical protein
MMPSYLIPLSAFLVSYALLHQSRAIFCGVPSTNTTTQMIRAIAEIGTWPLLTWARVLFAEQIPHFFFLLLAKNDKIFFEQFLYSKQLHSNVLADVANVRCVNKALLACTSPSKKKIITYLHCVLGMVQV